MDAISTVKLEYEQARETLLQKHSRNGVQLCARGRVYRAMAMAPSCKLESLADFEAKFNLLCAEAETLIENYNTAGKAYDAFTVFAGVQAEGLSVPECDCEGCRLQTERIGQ